MREIGVMDLNKDLENRLMEIKFNIWANGSKVKNMEKEN